VKKIALIVNLNRCVGCFACEVACQQEHGLPEGEKWIHVNTIGPTELDGELAMDFLPLTTDDCDLCQERMLADGRPFCAEVCPTQALSVCGNSGLLSRLKLEDRVQVCGIRELTTSLPVSHEGTGVDQ